VHGQRGLARKSLSFITIPGAIIMRVIMLVAGLLLALGRVSADTCIDCHKKVTPNIVTDWQLSKHSMNAVD
jgi:hypothetical protein